MTRRARGGGAGLGLALVCAIAEAHGGRAEIDGAGVRVLLPQADTRARRHRGGYCGAMNASFQPELWVDEAAAAIVFYESAFAAVVLHRVGEGDEIVAQLSVGGASFWVAAADPGLRRLSPRAIDGATGRTLLVVDDPDQTHARAVAAGATATSPIQDEHGWRLGRIVDPFGHEWEIGRPLGHWPPAS